MSNARPANRLYNVAFGITALGIVSVLGGLGNMTWKNRDCLGRSMLNSSEPVQCHNGLSKNEGGLLFGGWALQMIGAMSMMKVQARRQDGLTPNA